MDENPYVVPALSAMAQRIQELADAEGSAHDYTDLIRRARATALSYNRAGLKYGVADLLDELANALEAEISEVE